MRWAANASASRCAAGTFAAAALRSASEMRRPAASVSTLSNFRVYSTSGRIAAGAHVGHDVGRDPVDILVGVPIAPEEGRKFLSKPGAEASSL